MKEGVRRQESGVRMKEGRRIRKKGLADKIRFLNIAQGSLKESRYYLVLTNYLEYGNTSELLLPDRRSK
ncbi:MAG: four helix bundle protein [Okeania sp. SIO3I5]|uniref:four helix bundle protein n=1 Tax=Okeania sp. SIO3I5 TaxID=2607805 RepID=UPI0013BE4C32|nr:four helix bundle protein [Okeania sp. SIO3I5]